MSTESTGAAEPGAAAAVPSEPPTAIPPAPTEAPASATADAPSDALSKTPTTEPTEPTEQTSSTEQTEPGEGFEQVETLAAGEEPARRKRKLGVGAMLLIAVVAGPVIGGAIGYGIQAARPATPLPELVAPKLTYSAERVDPKALAAAGPQPLNIDGDLRELLIKRPDGSKDLLLGDGDGWMTADDQAETFGDSAEAFNNLLSSGFRRQAAVGWSVDDTQYRVNLMQYKPESAAGAISAMVSRTSGMDLSKIPGNDDSMIMVAQEATTYARSTEKYYWAEALARKGTVLMFVSVHSKNPVDRSQLEDIAKRQWERLA
ncbi:hypothetical protein [Kitasatospora sp. CB02891]|uniref:hypothetical protein n=1 Tax=Kitasatospora sp. CB02891 TaxID=2020329 RepID=UPI000C26FDD6|nr:hypothetical protein [Kitasatospora sp. CB02891]PJN21722.1 hypothetical protein CG736_31250 [Kitasatospora sp. CB02891]